MLLKKKGVARVATTLIVSLIVGAVSYNLGHKKAKDDAETQQLMSQRVKTLFTEGDQQSDGGASQASVLTTSNENNQNANSSSKLIDKHGELRGTWIATNYGINFPKAKYDVDKQKAEIDAILDNAKEKGFNSIFFQVRPNADALYNSAINSWSSVLTGKKMGTDPKWDPLEYIIYAGHKKGLEIHAWLNPLRVLQRSTDVNSYLEKLPDNHIAKNKDLLLYNDLVNDEGQTVTDVYLDPKKLEVKEHLKSTVKELVTNYPMLDGIHLDDYFYPERYPLPEGEGLEGAEANSRRDAVTDMVYSMYDTIKATNKNVTFSIAPFCVNKNSDANTKAGFENYHHLFADVEKWVKANKVDLIIPQAYFEKGHKLVDFTTIIQYWNNIVEGTNVKLAIGHSIEKGKKDAVAEEIDEQIQDSRNLSNSIGSVIYSYNDLDTVKDKLNSVYQ